jgi:hypothetical protein
MTDPHEDHLTVAAACALLAGRVAADRAAALRRRAKACRRCRAVLRDARAICHAMGPPPEGLSDARIEQVAGNVGVPPRRPWLPAVLAVAAAGAVLAAGLYARGGQRTPARPDAAAPTPVEGLNLGGGPGGPAHPRPEDLFGDLRGIGDALGRAAAAGRMLKPGPIKTLRFLSPEVSVYAASRLDVAAVYELARRQLAADSPAARRYLSAFELLAASAMGGADFRSQVLPKLGPEVAVLLERPQAAGSDAPVPTAAVLIELTDGRTRLGMGSLLRLLCSVPVSASGRDGGQPAAVREEVHRGVLVTVLEVGGPPAAELSDALGGGGRQVAPCFGFVGEFLVIASHPTMLRRLIDAEAEGDGAADG